MPRRPDELLAVQLPAAPPALRADAARNHEKVLCAARELVAQRGVDGVSMDAIAEAAGVGKGTVYRRFGDRIGLVQALLIENEAELQEGFIRGEPPLGPGAPPRDRLVAFFAALALHVETSLELLLAAEVSAGARKFATGVYGVHRFHVAMLLRQMGVDQRPEMLADMLLASCGVQLYFHMRLSEGWSRDEVVAGIARLIDGIEETV